MPVSIKMQECVKIYVPVIRTGLDMCLRAQNLDEIHLQVNNIYDNVSALESFLCTREDVSCDLNASEDGTCKETVNYPKATLLAELQQIRSARTMARSTYYVKRLLKGITSIRTNNINDINLNRWKEYDDVITDSLWLINHRDRTGEHNAEYWGNFIPQIPNQMLLRYTKVGDWVLDPFVGSGTTLIECQRLGRHGVGIELNPQVAASSTEKLVKENNFSNVDTRIVVGDSTQLDYPALVQEVGIDEFQLIIMHPPYHDIIKFSEDQRDLSNKPSVEEFIESISQVIRNTYRFLTKGRYLIVVIGDKYTQGNWIPLGFYTMQTVIKEGYSLKSIVVKNYEQTKGKRDQTQLWRYRALVGGFYIFKHEYIFVFQK